MGEKPDTPARDDIERTCLPPDVARCELTELAHFSAGPPDAATGTRPERAGCEPRVWDGEAQIRLRPSAELRERPADTHCARVHVELPTVAQPELAEDPVADVVFERADYDGVELVLEGDGSSRVVFDDARMRHSRVRIVGAVEVVFLGGDLEDTAVESDQAEAQAQVRFERTAMVAPDFQLSGITELSLGIHTVVEDGRLRAGTVRLTDAVIARSEIDAGTLEVTDASFRETTLAAVTGSIDGSMLVDSDIPYCSSLQLSRTNVQGGVLAPCTDGPLRVVRSTLDGVVILGGIDARATTLSYPTFFPFHSGPGAPSLSFIDGSYVGFGLFCGPAYVFAKVTTAFCAACGGDAVIEACYGDDVDIRGTDCAALEQSDCGP